MPLRAAATSPQGELLSKVGPLTHQQRVTRLYRHSLKALQSWAIDRSIINDEATKIRARHVLYFS